MFNLTRNKNIFDQCWQLSGWGVRARLDWKFYRQPPENGLQLLGIMGAQLRAQLKLLDTVIL